MKTSKVHYIHSLSYSAKDRLVGVFAMIAILAMLALFAVKIKSSKMFADVVHYHTYMKTAQGISTDTIVNISGIDVGRVSALDIDSNNKIHIEFFVYKDFQKLLRADSKGELNKLSLVGNAVIIIKAGSVKLPMLPDGAVIAVEEPVTTDDLIAGITPVIKNLESLVYDLTNIVSAVNPKAVSNSASDLADIVSNVRQLSDHVTEGKGTLGRILYDKSQEQSVNNSLLLIEKSLSGVATRINETQPVIENVNKLSIQSQQMLGDVRQSLQHLDKQLELVPELIKNTNTVLNHSRTVLESTDQTLKGAQKVWPLSNAISTPSSDLLIKERSLDE
jgi:phospholipid/cholesterol/gamma-HCH transport system substrate-binding protein